MDLEAHSMSRGISSATASPSPWPPSGAYMMRLHGTRGYQPARALWEGSGSECRGEVGRWWAGRHLPVSLTAASTCGRRGIRLRIVLLRAPLTTTNLQHYPHQHWCPALVPPIPVYSWLAMAGPREFAHLMPAARSCAMSAAESSLTTPLPIVDVGSSLHFLSSPSLLRTTAAPPCSVVTTPCLHVSRSK